MPFTLIMHVNAQNTNIQTLYTVFMGPKWLTTIVYQNIYQFTIVLEICRDLPLFGYSSLGNSSIMRYLSSIYLSSLKK